MAASHGNLPSPKKDLGEVVDYYKARLYKRALLYFIATLLFAFTIAMGFAVWVIGQPISSEGLAMLGAGLFAGIAGFIVALAAWKNRGLQVTVHANGIVRERRGEKNVVAWHDMAAIYQRITDEYVNKAYSHTSHVYTLECRDGNRLVFDDNLANVESLGQTLQQEIARICLPNLVQAIQRGEQLRFGRLSVEIEGLRKDDAFLFWKQIDNVKVEDGYFVVTSKWANWTAMNIADIPNLGMFLEVVNQILSGDPSRKER